MLRSDLTDTIRDAVLDELAAVGYGRLSMDGVARRAKAGKAALYRRWSSKQQMVTDVVASVMVPLVSAVDTGDLDGDVRAVLAAVDGWLTHPQFSRIVPDLVAEGARSTELARAVSAMVGEPRRELTSAVIDRAVARGDLRAELDRELAIDLFGALVYWRRSVRMADIDDAYLDRLTRATVAGLRAL